MDSVMMQVADARLSPFNELKARAVAARFLTLAGGRINILKLVKLIYLVDRESTKRRNIPVVGGLYVSMKYGPLTSELLDKINGEETRGDWSLHISDRNNHEVALEKEVGDLSDQLSDSEESLVDQLFEQTKDMSQWELSHWCHRNCSEWNPVETGMEPINPSAFLRAIGKTAEEQQRILAHAQEADFLENLLGAEN